MDGAIIPGLGVSYGLLAFTHLPTVLCFSWVAPLVVWMMSEPGKRIKAFARMAAGIGLGVGLAAVYVLPARLDEGKSWIVAVNDDPWFYYANNFLFTKFVSLEYKVRVLVLILSMAACVAMLYWVSRRFETNAKRRQLALLYLLIGAGALLMMTQLSIPIYGVFKLVQKIQFPARFATTLTVALAALAALTFPLLQKQKVVLAVVGMLAFGWIAADAWAGATAFSAWRKIPVERAARDRARTAIQIEYYMLWAKPADSVGLIEAPALEAFVAAHPARSLVMSAAGATATVESWRSRLVAIKVHVPEAGRMTVGHFYYRDWRAHIQESGQNVGVTPSPEGLIEVETPRGDYTLILELIRDTPERIGILLSEISLISIVGLFLVIPFR